jgi:diguanylate cyclase (GGDEF)-like protein
LLATTLPASSRLLVAIAVATVLAVVPTYAAIVGPLEAWPFLWLGVVSGLAAVSLLAAGLRSTGRLRAAWLLLAVVATVAAYLHPVLAVVDPALESPGLRMVAVVCAATALVAFARAGRGLRGWLLLGLDGWLLGGSLFIALWLVTVTPARLEFSRNGLLLESTWVLVAFALASIAFALTRRLPAGDRAGGVAVSIAAALAANGDLYRAFFSTTGWSAGGRAAFLGSWTAAMVMIALAPWISRDPFARVGTDRLAHGTVRWSYVAACGAVAASLGAWLLGRPPDFMLTTVAVTLLVSVVTSQTLLAVENARLIEQASHDADLFRDRATRDALTGLPNRGEFTGRVDRALTTLRSDDVAVLFIDLDGFKDVNDSYGHAIGDELLVEAAGRLAREVRESDVVGRFGGDEFVALLAGCSDESALEIAERLRAALSDPYRIGHRDVVVSASIGLARPAGDDDAESALRNADLALYRAKEGGRDRVSVYEPTMHSNVLRRLDLAARLRHALAHDRLSLAYQPIVDLRTGTLYAMEALLRFERSDLAGWDVTEVIEAAEESGLIVPVGSWVLDAAVGTLAAWLRAGHDIRMSVNVSARQLEVEDFVRQVHNTLLYHSVPPSALILEITEHQLVRDVEESTRELGRLRALGVSITLDDFGTGYSSLAYLPRLPLDGLKIDRSLVGRVGGARDTVPGVLRLGRDLSLSVVAEGVETVDQLVMLRSSGCTLGQGHLFSRAVPVREATALVARGRVDLPLEAVSPVRIFVSDDETPRVTA